MILQFEVDDNEGDLLLNHLNNSSVKIEIAKIDETFHQSGKTHLLYSKISKGNVLDNAQLESVSILANGGVGISIKY